MGAGGGVIACSLGCVWSLAIVGHRGPGPLRASVLLSQVLVEGSHLPYTSTGLLRWQPHHRALVGRDTLVGQQKGTAGRFRRLEDSGEDPPARKYVPNASSPSGWPHPVPLANDADVLLAARFCTVAPFGPWVQTH